MADFDDLRLNKTPEAPPPPPPQRRWLVMIVAVVLVLALVAVWYYLRRDSDLDRVDIATEQTVAQSPPARPLGQPGEDIDLPPLDESDALVRDLVRALSQHPLVLAWLTTDQLIRNFAVVVMNVSGGETPAGHLHTIAPEGRFQIRQQRGTTYIDPRSYSRFDGHANAVSALDARGTARLYATLKPRIDEAYRELAGRDADFDRALERAIVELLEAPIVEGDVAVEPRIVGYAYADPALESLSRAQQQLLRMGPRNARVVQEKLREIARHLGIDEASLPRERVVRADR